MSHKQNAPRRQRGSPHPTWGNRASVPSYAGSERAAGQRTRPAYSVRSAGRGAHGPGLTDRRRRNQHPYRAEYATHPAPRPLLGCWMRRGRPDFHRGPRLDRVCAERGILHPRRPESAARKAQLRHRPSHDRRRPVATPAPRPRPRVAAVPAARATAGAAARARRCAGRPPWPALRAPAHDGADLPGQPGRVPLIAFEHAGKLPTEGLPDAVHGCAPQAPDTHNDPYTPAIERDVGHDPLMIRVHPARFDAADRTGHGPARSPRPDPDPPALVCHLLDDQRRQPRKHRAHKLIDITHSSS
jgi:hypothetical protein